MTYEKIYICHQILWAFQFAYDENFERLAKGALDGP